MGTAARPRSSVWISNKPAALRVWLQEEPEGGRETGAGDHTAGGNNEKNAFMMSV